MPQKYWSLPVITLGLAALSLTPVRPADAKSKAAPVVISEANSNAVLWRDPVDIASRNLFYGAGGEKDQPHAPYTFVEEDMNGTNPKIVVTDRDGVKWTVKLGIEARPETAASRLVWAAGYYANEDYYLADLQVLNMPAHLKRGAKLVAPDGTMHDARLKRHISGEKDIGNWKWRAAPFAGTREFNGLKVMMALVNNWDLKDDNNRIYSVKDSGEQIYEVSDIGATFGTPGMSFPFRHSKGDVDAYARSKFIAKITPEYVNFRTPARPSVMYAERARSFIQRTHLDGLLNKVPRDDARWMGQLLSHLSAGQIQDAFRAADYTPDQIDEFSKTVQDRIAELNRL
jgi:hypothetical protein